MPAPVRPAGETRQLIIKLLEKTARPMTWPEITRAVEITAGYRTQKRMLQLGEIQHAGFDLSGTQLYAAGSHSVSQPAVKYQTTQPQSVKLTSPEVRKTPSLNSNDKVALPILLQSIFECRACQSVTSSEVPRTVLDNWNAELVLMAQAPSGVGVRVSGVHWLDESGRLRPPGGTYLNGYLETVGYSIDPLSKLPRPYTTNAVQCWPGAKRNSKGKLRDRKPSSLEIKNCQKWWLAELDLLRPIAVLLLGQLSADSFASASGVSTDFETMLDWEQGNAVTIGRLTCSYFTVPHPVAPYSGSRGGRNDYYDFAFGRLRETLSGG